MTAGLRSTAATPLSPQTAARELQIRRAARSDIISFARAIDVPGRPVSENEDDDNFLPVESVLAEHHVLLLNKLDEVSNTPHGRLMIFMPPGSAKSTYASVVFPAFYLGKNSGKKIILTSYGDDLSRRLGRRTRAIVRQKRYGGIFNAGLTSDSSAVQDFTLTNGSDYMSAGILSGVTGNRANGLVIDDPVKGREQANSDATSQKTFDAYQDDLKTRLVPGGFINIIQTRWSQKDLAGRILPDDWAGESGRILCKDGFEWEVICLQARCEVKDDPLGRKHGEYLWPAYFDRKHWSQFEANPRTWASLYQQLPTQSEGDLFKPDAIKVIDALPAGHITWGRGWDFGSTTSGDFSAGAKVGRMADGRYIIGDMVRLRRGPDERDAALLNTASLDGVATKISIPQDPGQAGKTQVLYLIRSLSGYRVDSSPESGDKVTRAEPFAAQINVGNVLMLRGEWNTALIDEMRMFPNGNFDDQVDALSRAFTIVGLGVAPMNISSDAVKQFAAGGRR